MVTFSACKLFVPFVFHSNGLEGYSSVGRAAVSKTVGRGFEPCCPCQKLNEINILIVDLTGESARYSLTQSSPVFTHCAEGGPNV